MNEKRYYIAYGSNLSVEQMASRCPHAKIAGRAVLDGWKLVFKIHATIEPCENSKVPVLVWEIDGGDERRLDAYEGAPVYYFKKDLDIRLTDLKGRHPRSVTAMVYIMADGHQIHMPMKGYYDVIAEGYERFGFDQKILREALLEAKEAEHVFP